MNIQQNNFRCKIKKKKKKKKKKTEKKKKQKKNGKTNIAKNYQ